MTVQKKCFLISLLIFISICGCKTNKIQQSPLSNKISNFIKSSTSFDELWVVSDSLELLVDPSNVIGAIKSISTFKNGNIVVADDLGHHLLIFDKRGKMLLSVGKSGRGPGEFEHLTDIGVDRENNLLVLDNSLTRVSKFDSLGNFITSYNTKIVSRYILPLKDGGFLLYNPNFMPVTDFKMFTKYNQLGEHKFEFGDAPKSAIVDGIPLVGGSFIEDSLGNIYTVHVSEYKVNKYDNSGNFVAAFAREAPFYVPIKSPFRPFDTVQVNAFTAVGNIMMTSENLVLVVISKGRPRTQWIEIYDTEGNFLNGIEVPSNLSSPLFIGSNTLYFEGEQENVINEKGNLQNIKLYGYKFKQQ